MPSATRFSFLPVIVTSSAAAGGLLGAFVAVGLLSPTANQNSKIAPPSAQEVKPAERAETTGAAPSESAATTGCDKQTWPYLSRTCAEEMQRKNRNVRVIATDRIDRSTIGAIEAPATKPDSSPAQSAAE